ncbi:DnaJ domain-containing protein [Haloparvum alkalitolerans]|uniref:DnaJ domain-containing protein n=1 Tax=Haloparvum alkalitolerans TaxID=1042953 RepID=UPI003CF9583F
MPADFYDLLEVDRDADTSEIKRAYREKARTYHPDVNDDPRARDQFATLNRARETLTDPKERSRYDRLGHQDYVSQHLDGLPTLSRPSDADAGGDGAGGDGAGGGETADARDGTADEAESRTDAGRSDVGSAASDSATDESATGASATDTSATETATGSGPTGEASQSTGSNEGSSRGASRTGSGASRTNASGSTGTAERAGSTAERGASSAADRSGHASRKRGLRRGWTLSAAALVVYAVGLSAAVATAPDAANGALDAVLADPAGALTAASPLPDPVTAVRGAAALAAGAVTPASLGGAALGVGLVALPAAVGGTVARFGSGAATLYPVGVGVPAGWALVRPFVPAPLAADLLALAVAPLVAGVWFLADIGRYLRS